MRKPFLCLLLCGQVSTAHAEMSMDTRKMLLKYYPCATFLTDDKLHYLAEWANATSTDPCMLTVQEFSTTFSEHHTSE